MRLLLTALILFNLQQAQADNILFSPENILEWNAKSFVGQTYYTIVYDELLQKNVIRAESNSSASGLFYEKKIDLEKTPWLSWSWRAEKFPTVEGEKSKVGDDFVARIYIVIKDGWTPLSTKAVSYVWAKNATLDSEWPNPFTGKRAMMLVTQTGEKNTGWVTEKRNLKEDLKRLFGKEFKKIDAIAIMADSDNSESSTVGFISDVKLLANSNE